MRTADVEFARDRFLLPVVGALVYPMVVDRSNLRITALRGHPRGRPFSLRVGDSVSIRKVGADEPGTRAERAISADFKPRDWTVELIDHGESHRRRGLKFDFEGRRRLRRGFNGADSTHWLPGADPLRS